MSATLCLDTGAWLEFFNAGPHGPRIRDLLARAEVLTPAVVAAELVEAARRRKLNTKSFLEFLEAKSTIVPLDAPLARAAGRINAHYAEEGSAWTLHESWVLATARQAHAKLLTTDPVYEGLPGVEVLAHPPMGFQHEEKA